MTTKNEKKRIFVTQEQQERMAAQSAQKIQAFANELSQVQSRRLELTGGLLTAHVTKHGLRDTTPADVQSAVLLAGEAVRLDSVQKWTGIAALFAELGVEGPQPHLEWAAKQVGVVMFPDAKPAEPERLVSLATGAELTSH